MTFDLHQKWKGHLPQQEKSIFEMKSVHHSHLETLWLQLFQSLSLGDFKWPLTSWNDLWPPPKTNVKSFLFWDVVITQLSVYFFKSPQTLWQNARGETKTLLPKEFCSLKELNTLPYGAKRPWRTQTWPTSKSSNDFNRAKPWRVSRGQSLWKLIDFSIS